MNTPRVKNRTINHSEAGFSLLEMIIAVGVFLIVMSAVYGLLQVGIVSRNTINNRSETITNARAAVSSFGKDVINAGLGFSRVGGVVPDDFASQYLNTQADNGQERDLLTAIVAGNNVRESDLSVNGIKNDVVAFAFRDLQFNGGNSLNIIDAPLLSIINNSVVLKTPTDGCVNCSPYDLYLVESTDGKQAVVMATAIPDTNTIVLGVGDPLGINQGVIGNSNSRSILTKCLLGNTNNCINYDAGVTAKKIYWVSFSVDVDGTLVRTTYGNNPPSATTSGSSGSGSSGSGSSGSGSSGSGSGGTIIPSQIQKQPLAYGVQNFQVRYLMQDGTMSDDPSANGAFPMKMNEVVQVEITLTIKPANDEQAVTNTQLINVTSTFSTRNLKYDVE